MSCRAARSASSRADDDLAAEEAAEAQAVIDAGGGCPPGWSSDEVRGCFDPGSDLDGSGIADVNE
ncbi:hypothetical protein [Geodermatophilus sp. SYSU D00698]